MGSPPEPASPGTAPRVVAIMGPTASGKTRLAVALAKELGAELVNADSRQAIVELTVGVGKPTSAELQGVACHGLNWSHLGQPFSVAAYRTLAQAVISDIASRGRPAIVVGGTGLYIRALLGGFDFGSVAPDQSRAVPTGSAADARSMAARAALDLRQLDPRRALAVDMENPRRVLRAAELARAGAHPRQSPPPWSSIKLGCRVGRLELRQRIEARSDRLVGEPLREEVELLAAQGFSLELLGRSAIGYAEVVDWARGQSERPEAVQRVAGRTWRYAKSQMTWLRSEPDLHWVNAEGSLNEMVSQCLVAIDSGLMQGTR